KLGSEDLYLKALQDGVVEPATPTAGGAGFSGGQVADAAAKAGAATTAGKTELVLSQNIAMGDGGHPNNPWLLELPDPITRACWDNYVMISPTMAKELLELDVSVERQANKYEYFPEKKVLRVKTGNKEIALPFLVVPGMHNNTVAIAVGYGRSEKLGKAVVDAGKNAFGLAGMVDNNISLSVPNVTVEKTDDIYKVAT